YYVTWGSNAPDYDDGVLQGGAVTGGHFHTDPSGVIQVVTGSKNPSVRRSPVTSTQAADLQAGRWYHNVHSSTCPSGEIRGQMLAVSAPVPAGPNAWAILLGVGLAAG